MKIFGLVRACVLLIGLASQVSLANQGPFFSGLLDNDRLPATSVSVTQKRSWLRGILSRLGRSSPFDSDQQKSSEHDDRWHIAFPQSKGSESYVGFTFSRDELASIGVLTRAIDSAPMHEIVEINGRHHFKLDIPWQGQISLVCAYLRQQTTPSVFTVSEANRLVESADALDLSDDLRNAIHKFAERVAEDPDRPSREERKIVVQNVIEKADRLLAMEGDMRYVYHQLSAKERLEAIRAMKKAVNSLSSHRGKKHVDRAAREVADWKVMREAESDLSLIFDEARVLRDIFQSELDTLNEVRSTY